MVEAIREAPLLAAEVNHDTCKHWRTAERSHVLTIHVVSHHCEKGWSWTLLIDDVPIARGRHHQVTEKEAVYAAWTAVGTLRSNFRNLTGEAQEAAVKALGQKPRRIVGNEDAVVALEHELAKCQKGYKMLRKAYLERVSGAKP